VRIPKFSQLDNRNSSLGIRRVRQSKFVIRHFPRTRLLQLDDHQRQAVDEAAPLRAAEGEPAGGAEGPAREEIARSQASLCDQIALA